MNTGKLEDSRIKSRKLWDKHGSWLVLVVVGALSWNAGTEWQSYKTGQIVRTIVENGKEERDELRDRLRVIHDRYAGCAASLPGAVEKADKALDKALKIIETEKVAK